MWCQRVKMGMPGVMATTWMAAAVQEGIPTAFVVDKDSKLAWIGHPMMMEEPLTKIVAGKWDVDAARHELEPVQAAAVRKQALKPGDGEPWGERTAAVTDQRHRRSACCSRQGDRRDAWIRGRTLATEVLTPYEPE